MSSQVFGNLLAGQILGSVSQTAYMILMTAISAMFFMVFLILPEPKPITWDNKI